MALMMTLSEPGFTRFIFSLCFLLAFGVRVRGSSGTQPTDIPTSIVPSNHTVPSSSPSSLSKTARLSLTSSAEINDLLDENFDDGTLTLDFSSRGDDQDSCSAVELLGYFLSSDGKELRTTVHAIIIPWLPTVMDEDLEDFALERSYNESQLLDFVAKVENLENFQ